MTKRTTKRATKRKAKGKVGGARPGAGRPAGAIDSKPRVPKIPGPDLPPDAERPPELQGVSPLRPGEQPTQAHNALAVYERTLAQTRKEQLAAEKRQLELDKARGLLISRDEYQAELAKRVRVLKRSLLALPKRVAADLDGASGAQIQETLELRLAELIRGYSGEGAK